MKPPKLQTERFILKAYRKKDESRFVEIGVDPAVVAFMGNASGDEKAERELFQRIFKLYAQENKQRKFWIWGIYEADQLIGHLELKETPNTKHDELEIVYMVHPKERKRGIMTEILAYLKANQQRWQRNIIATVDPNNEQSYSLLTKWGITKTEQVKDPESPEPYLKVWLQ